MIYENSQIDRRYFNVAGGQRILEKKRWKIRSLRSPYGITSLHILPSSLPMLPFIHTIESTPSKYICFILSVLKPLLQCFAFSSSKVKDRCGIGTEGSAPLLYKQSCIHATSYRFTHRESNLSLS